MSSSVHILAACLNLDLLPATLLAFQTIRTGFPDAPLWVWGNELPLDAQTAVKRACTAVGAKFVPLEKRCSHDLWVERMIETSPEPFWICDADVVFFGGFAGLGSDALITGRYEPAFVEPWTGTRRVSRIHPCLMRIDAPRLRMAIKSWLTRWHPKGFPCLPETQFVRQCFVPDGPGRPPLFYDTCAGIYQALGGQAFTEEENSRFEHLHCGSYSDKIEPAIQGLSLVHKAITENPECSKGLQQKQARFYLDNVWH